MVPAKNEILMLAKKDDVAKNNLKKNTGFQKVGKKEWKCNVKSL
jgi:hypothetical protein